MGMMTLEFDEMNVNGKRVARSMGSIKLDTLNKCPQFLCSSRKDLGTIIEEQNEQILRRNNQLRIPLLELELKENRTLLGMCSKYGGNEEEQKYYKSRIEDLEDELRKCRRNLELI